MKKEIFILLTLLGFGCTGNRKKNGTGTEITFRKEAAVHVRDVKAFKSKTVIPLETTDRSLVGHNASLRKAGDNFFVYSSHRPNPVLRFDSNGNFLNTVGNVGIGPGEFPVLTDVFISAADNSVEILSNGMIQRYDCEGKSLKSLKLDIPAFSFTRTGNGYWFYTGNNKACSPSRLFRTDSALRVEGEYLNDDSNMLPVMETVFGNSSYLTLRENFYHNLYRITDDRLELSYTIKFPGLEIPPDAYTKPPMEVVDYLRKYDYATVMRYLENRTCVYLMIMENKSGDVPSIYQWFINKKSGREILVLTDLVMESYLLYPQLLTDDNRLYYIGYPVENRDEEVNPNLNPSVVIVDINEE